MAKTVTAGIIVAKMGIAPVWPLAVVLAAALAGAVDPARAADPFVREELRIPLPEARPNGLEALLVRPAEPGRYPLALINHGSPRSGADRPDMTPWRMLPEAIEFARRGWAAVIMMRRGYGDSGGGWVESNGGCANPDYVASGVASSVDLKGAVAALARRPDIDASRVISVGISAGGFATVALAADPPPGLVAAISFAGGRGSVADDEVCREERLTAAFATFGKRARVPMLWVYAANDHYFRPALAQEFKRAFMAGGGIVEFVAAPAFGTDGHGLFSPAGIPIWSRYVDKFLESRNLVLRERLLPPLRPSLRAPSVLSANGRNDFESYLTSGPHKAFAVSPRGAYGWRIGQRTVDAARTGALELCEANGSDCSVVFVDDAAIPKGRATR